MDFRRYNLTSTADVCRRQMLTSKVDPRAVRVKINETSHNDAKNKTIGAIRIVYVESSPSERC